MWDNILLLIIAAVFGYVAVMSVRLTPSKQQAREERIEILAGTRNDSVMPRPLGFFAATVSALLCIGSLYVAFTMV